MLLRDSDLKRKSRQFVAELQVNPAASPRAGYSSPKRQPYRYFPAELGLAGLGPKGHAGLRLEASGPGLEISAFLRSVDNATQAGWTAVVHPDFPPQHAPASL